MAILGKITATVLVNGKALHDMETENPDLVVKFIEAISGAKFEISVSILGSFKITTDGIMIEIYLDGYNVQSMLPYEHQIGIPDVPFYNLFQGAEQKEDGRWFRRPYVFSEILGGMFSLHSNTVLCSTNS